MLRALPRLLATAAVLAVTAAVLGGAAPAGAAVPVPSSNGKIAFASYVDGDYDIYVMDADGSNVQNLTTAFDEPFPSDCCDDTSPAWSPDGTKIAFSSSRDGVNGNQVYVMDADGSNQVRLTAPEEGQNFGPAWSPDGTQIAFTSDRGPDWDVFTMNADGSGQTDVTSPNQTLEYMDFQPQWSPDGSKLIFTGVRDGAYEILQTNPDGTGEVNLTGDDDPPYSFISEYASYRPDGSKIVFHRQVNNGSNDWDLVVMDPDGSNKVEVLGDDTYEDLFPRWSADGNQILFQSNRSFGSEDVYAIDYPPATAAATASKSSGTTAGPTVRRLTTDGMSGQPSQQPVPAALRRATLAATLRGTSVVPGPGDPDGRGSARIRTNAGTGTLCYDVRVANIQLPATAELHRGARGATGPKVASLGSFDPAGMLSGCRTGMSKAAVLAVNGNPQGYYVLVRSADLTNGALRGQLALAG
jgi:Tol biopolymer transport system component